MPGRIRLRWSKTNSPHTVRCRYNAVNFHPNPHKRHPITHSSPARARYGGVFCEHKFWRMFCLRRFDTICKIMLCSTALQRHLTAFVNLPQSDSGRHQKFMKLRTFPHFPAKGASILVQTLKRYCCHFDNFRCSEWRQIYQNDMNSPFR